MVVFCCTLTIAVRVRAFTLHKKGWPALTPAEQVFRKPPQTLTCNL